MLKTRYNVEGNRIEEVFSCDYNEMKRECQSAKELLDELQDFAIWLTSCGYDFSLHERYNKNKHLLTQDYNKIVHESIE